MARDTFVIYPVDKVKGARDHEGALWRFQADSNANMDASPPAMILPSAFRDISHTMRV
jgi:hypothetical protein